MSSSAVPQTSELPMWQWTLLVIGMGCAFLILGAAFLPWFHGIGLSEFPLLAVLAGCIGVLGLLLVLTNASSRKLLVLTGALSTLVWLLLYPLPWKQRPAAEKPASASAHLEPEPLDVPARLVFFPPSTRAKDVMIVLEASAHMAGRMEQTKNDIRALARQVWEKNPDSRIGLTLFRSNLDKKMKLIYEEKPGADTGPFTRDADEFSRKVGALRADGGGDEPESALDAVELASKQPFREDADKIVILITDVPPRIPDRNIRTSEEAAGLLRRARVKQLHIMCPGGVLGTYNPLRKDFEGQHFELFAGGGSGFTSVLEKLSRDIADISYKQRALTPSSVKKNQIRADILFLLDTTGSMGGAIRGVQEGISRFARELEAKKLDARIGLISFKDQTVDPLPLEVLTFRQMPFRVEEPVITSVPEVRVLGPERTPFVDRMAALDALLDSIVPSGNSPEQNSLDAVAIAARQSFRPDADRVIVLISDSPPLTPDREMIDPIDVVDVLKEKKIDYVHLMVPEKSSAFLSTLERASRGKTEPFGGRMSTGWIDELPPLPKSAASGTASPPGGSGLTFDGDSPATGPARAGVGVWIAFFAATGMAICFLLVSLCRPFGVSRSGAFSDLPGPLQRFGPLLASQGFAVMIGLLLIGLR